MQVTKDKYEFPINIADSVAELAALTGVKKESISSMICHKRQGWKKVIVEDEVENESCTKTKSKKRSNRA